MTTDTPGRWNARTAIRVVRLVAVVAALVVTVVAAVLIAVSVGPPTREELMEEAGLAGRSQLLIGVRDDQPGTGYRDPETGQFAGFDIDIAYMVAEDLGFRPEQVRLLSIESEDRAKMLGMDDQRRPTTVDLVVGTFSITEERESRPEVSFSAPYLLTEQTVLTLEGHPRISALTDLRGTKVCTLAVSTAQGPLAEAGVVPVSKQQISQCIDAVRKGEVVAVETDAAILAGYATAPDLMLHDIGYDVQEQYGINTGGNEALRTLVNYSLYKSQKDPTDHRWEEAYNRHLRPLQAAAGSQPVAIDRQPEAPKVNIRQWPWERFD